MISDDYIDLLINLAIQPVLFRAYPPFYLDFP